MADAQVRAATPADAGTLGLLQLQIWQQAYSEFLPAAVLLADADARAAAWAGRLVDPGPILIALEGVVPVGFSAVGTDVVDGSGEVETLLVLPRWGRRGHGGRLLGAAAGHLRGLGADRGGYWVPEPDTASAAFLAAVGWRPDGQRRAFDTGETILREHHFAGSLDLVLI